MKTYLALLTMTDGRPVMDLAELGKLMGLTERTVQNKVYSKTLPIKTFKLDATTVAHVEDVANYIDAQREAAQSVQSDDRPTVGQKVSALALALGSRGTA